MHLIRIFSLFPVKRYSSDTSDSVPWGYLVFFILYLPTPLEFEGVYIGGTIRHGRIVKHRTRCETKKEG